MFRSDAGRSFVEADLLSEPVEAGPLHEPRRGERDAVPPAIREDVEQQEPLERVERLYLPAGFRFIHEHAERLDELAVLHAGRARGLARPAVQAQIEVLLHVVVEWQRAVDDLPHEVDAAARANRPRSGLDVGGATRGAEPAVDAIEHEFVVDVRAMRLGSRDDGEGSLFGGGDCRHK